MAASPLPETYRRDDWPRLVAKRVNSQENRTAVLEGNSVSRAKARFLYG